MIRRTKYEIKKELDTWQKFHVYFLEILNVVGGISILQWLFDFRLFYLTSFARHQDLFYFRFLLAVLLCAITWKREYWIILVKVLFATSNAGL